MTYPGGIIQNYGDLQTAVADWIWRVGDTNVAAAAPQIIANFEASFRRVHRTQEMNENVTGTVPSPPGVPIPSDFIELIRFELLNLPAGTPNQTLVYVTPNRAGLLDSTLAPAGTPQWFTILDGSFIISPQPWVPAGATYSIDYYGFTPLATAGGGVNWLLTKHPDYYLYGSLLQAAAYIDDKETVAQWTTAHDRARAELIEAGKKAKVAGPLVMMPSMQFRTTRRRYPTPGA